MPENFPVPTRNRGKEVQLIKAHLHGNTGCAPANTLIVEKVRNVVVFVTQHAEANAILLPSYQGGFLAIRRVTYRSLPVQQREPSDCCMKTLSQLSIAYSTFTKVWRNFLPHVVVACPMTDLCAICQKNSAAIICSVNLSEEKSEVNHHYRNFTMSYYCYLSHNTLKAAEEHLMRATCEWSLYRSVVEESRDGIHQHFTTTKHYSFDFAQQVH